MSKNFLKNALSKQQQLIAPQTMMLLEFTQKILWTRRRICPTKTAHSVNIGRVGGTIRVMRSNPAKIPFIKGNPRRNDYMIRYLYIYIYSYEMHYYWLFEKTFCIRINHTAYPILDYRIYVHRNYFRHATMVSKNSLLIPVCIILYS